MIISTICKCINNALREEQADEVILGGIAGTWFIS